jgi:hypothetical protein
MFRKLTATGAALATVAALALVAAPANAMPPMNLPGDGTVVTVEPTGPGAIEVGKDYETDDEYEDCTKATETANSYLKVARQWEARGRAGLADYMEMRAGEIAGDANKKGCNIIQPA